MFARRAVRDAVVWGGSFRVRGKKKKRGGSVLAVEMCFVQM